jgi:hypothetical protein
MHRSFEVDDGTGHCFLAQHLPISPEALRRRCLKSAARARPTAFADQKSGSVKDFYSRPRCAFALTIAQRRSPNRSCHEATGE